MSMGSDYAVQLESRFKQLPCKRQGLAEKLDDLTPFLQEMMLRKEPNFGVACEGTPLLAPRRPLTPELRRSFRTLTPTTHEIFNCLAQRLSRLEHPNDPLTATLRVSPPAKVTLVRSSAGSMSIKFSSSLRLFSPALRLHPASRGSTAQATSAVDACKSPSIQTSSCCPAAN